MRAAHLARAPGNGTAKTNSDLRYARQGHQLRQGVLNLSPNACRPFRSFHREAAALQNFPTPVPQHQLQFCTADFDTQV